MKFILKKLQETIEKKVSHCNSLTLKYIFMLMFYVLYMAALCALNVKHGIEW